jgi:hypothetical protein
MGGSMHGNGPRRAPATIVSVALAAALLGGCELLYPPEDNLGTALATYVTGHATMTIAGEDVELDQISPGPHLITDMGAEVYWFNDDGWGLRLSGGGAVGAFAMPAMISIDRVQTTYWSAMDDGGQCRVTLDEIDAKGLRGSATCTGLRWSDVLRGGVGGFWDPGGGPYVEGQPPFDATITFEAQPQGTSA